MSSFHEYSHIRRMWSVDGPRSTASVKPITGPSHLPHETPRAAPHTSLAPWGGATATAGPAPPAPQTPSPSLASLSSLSIRISSPPPLGGTIPRSPGFISSSHSLPVKVPPRARQTASSKNPPRSGFELPSNLALAAQATYPNDSTDSRKSEEGRQSQAAGAGAAPVAQGGTSTTARAQHHQLFMRAMHDIVVQRRTGTAARSDASVGATTHGGGCVSDGTSSELGGINVVGTFQRPSTDASANALQRVRPVARSAATPTATARVLAPLPKPTQVERGIQASATPPGYLPSRTHTSSRAPIPQGSIQSFLNSIRTKRADVLERELRDQQAAATRRGMTLLDYLAEKQRVGNRHFSTSWSARALVIPAQTASFAAPARASTPTPPPLSPLGAASAIFSFRMNRTGAHPGALPHIQTTMIRDQMVAAQRRGMTLEGYLEWKQVESRRKTGRFRKRARET
ncbi:hypothetical protein I317_00727 [Kwoniella heveanensis CBS 569]|nr:hypothetical protein I317_00727 [Kwoniella heveanensis CBS 569]